MDEILMERFVEHAKSKWVEKAAKKKNAWNNTLLENSKTSSTKYGK